MIYTTYFAKLRSLPKNVIPVSIALYPPKWYAGLQYKALAPKASTLKYWKESNDPVMCKQVQYKVEYSQLVLGFTDCKDVLKELGMLIGLEEEDWYKRTDINIVLVCFEKKGEFCHRHIAADWFRINGIEVEEWK